MTSEPSSPTATRLAAKALDLAEKVAFFVVALPAVLRATSRLHRHRDRPFDQLAHQMRQVPTFRRKRLRNPRYLAATVARLAPILPPRGYGPCFKRSLLLLDLWARCNLEPTLHLGAVSDRKDRHFHAWVTTHEGGPRTSNGGHTEIWAG